MLMLIGAAVRCGGIVMRIFCTAYSLGNRADTMFRTSAGDFCLYDTRGSFWLLHIVTLPDGNELTHPSRFATRRDAVQHIASFLGC